MKNKEVIKHSSTIQITNKITLIQRKTWNILLANAYNDLPDKTNFTIKMKDLSTILGYPDRNDEHLKTSLEGLMVTLIKGNVLDKDGITEWVATTLLAMVKVKDGICTYEYSSFLREKLYNPNMYAKINLIIQNQFKSKYSLALYELFLDYLGSNQSFGETPWIELSKFRLLMGIDDDDYPDFKKLNQIIIKESVSEINNLDNLKVTVRVVYKKELRKVIALKFYILRNEQSTKLFSASTDEVISDVSKDIFNLFSEIGVSNLTSNDLIKNYSPENIKNQIEWLKYRKPKDPAAMLIQAIKEEWAMPGELMEEKQKENSKKMLEDVINKAKKAKYIILPSSKKCKISSIQDNGYIEIIGEHNRKYMVQPSTVCSSSFE